MKYIRVLVVLFLILCLIPLPQITAQVPDLPNQDTEVYFGHYWGAAGIVDGLLTIRDSPLVSQSLQQRIDELISDAILGIWDSRYYNVNDEQVAAWEKFDGGGLYPAKKYGAAGIVDVLLDAYQETDNPDYLEYAEAAIDETYKQAQHWDLPHWPYVYLTTRLANGVFITDLAFGSMGIIDTTLKLYNITQNQDHLDLAIQATNWVYNISYPRELDTLNRVIPWYSSTGELNITYTSFMQGNAGVIPVLLDLYKYTSNSTWSNWALFLGDWLVSKQSNEGAWNHNPFARNPRYDTGFELGVSGVLTALRELNNFNASTNIDEAIGSGYQWLDVQFISNSTHQIFPYHSQITQAKYSLYEGMAGINRVFREGGYNSDHLLASYRWILNEALYEIDVDGNDLLAVYPSTSNQNYVDLSYTYGLTGIIEELVLANQELDLDISSDVVSKFIDTLEYYQLDSGLWPRQFVVEQSIWEQIPNQVYIILGLIIIGLLVYQFRIKKRKLENEE